MKSETHVAILGAGPYGLSLASHLAAAGIERVVLGDPHSTWRDNMPEGMLLKSEPYGSDIAAPVPGYRLGDYCMLHGVAYRDRSAPVPVETFLAYAAWFTSQLVPDVERVEVSALLREGGGFILRVADGPELHARKVVVAAGCVPFAHVPRPLSALPADLLTHTAWHRRSDPFSGRHVAVVGAGQSALEAAALLSESGAEVELVVRAPALTFADKNPDPKGWWSPLLRPAQPLGEGWRCTFYQRLPDAFRGFPAGYRVLKSYRSFGPSGAWWLRPRIDGKVIVRSGCSVRTARATASGVELSLEGPGAAGNGSSTVAFDHVVAGTGYRTDLDKLPYLEPELKRSLVLVGGAPRVSRAFESSVPGLYFVGFPAAPSLGPVMRFLAGTGFSSRRITRHLGGGTGTQPAAHPGQHPAQPGEAEGPPRPPAGEAP